MRRCATLQPQLPGTKVEVTGAINRPPMARTPAGVALFRKAEAIAAELGFAVTETGTGGGSDGNFTAALGVPTLDGLGVDGRRRARAARARRHPVAARARRTAGRIAAHAEAPYKNRLKLRKVYGTFVSIHYVKKQLRG